MSRSSKQLEQLLAFEEVTKECAKAGCQPADVVAVLIRIAADIALTTKVTDKDSWLEFAGDMWDMTEQDKGIKLPSGPPAEA